MDNPCRVCGVVLPGNRLNVGMGFHLCRAHEHVPFARQHIEVHNIEQQRNKLMLLFGIAPHEARQVHHVAMLASFDAFKNAISDANRVPQKLQQATLITIAIMMRDNAEFALQQQRDRTNEKAAGVQPGLPGGDGAGQA
jgi:hypothetical protein